MPAFRFPKQICSPRRSKLLRLALAGTAISLLSACGGPRIREAVVPGPGVVVLAAGDIADCRYKSPEHSGAWATAALIERELAKSGGANIVTLGDHTYPVGLPAEFNDCYAPSWGRFKAKTLPAPGNHEYYTKNAPGYFQYFAQHAGPHGDGYYSVTLGSWRLIALNSALRGEKFKTQLEWLKSELAPGQLAPGQSAPGQNTQQRSAKRSCILAFWHHPVFSSGGHAANPFMMPAWKLLSEAGTDVVLTAHDHNYERFARQDASGQADVRGIRQFVVGTGGADLTLMRFTKPNSERRHNTSHGVLKLNLKAAGYDWEFLSVNGTHVDSGSAFCS